MITASINREGGKTQVLVSGHSGYASKGADIICAGVSALTESYSMVAEEICDCDRLDIADGFMDVVCTDSHENDVMIRVFETGLEAMQDNYPDFVELEYGTKIM